MKKIKVYSLPSHQTEERTSGVDFARVIQPMEHLHGYSDGEVEFEVTVYDMEKQTTDPDHWDKVAKDHDIIFFNYIYNPWGFAHMGVYARKYGTKMVMDLDDDLWDIKADNPTAQFYKRGSQELRNLGCIIDEVDHLTVTNDYLKHVTMNHTNKRAKEITAIDNFIDLEKYDYHPEFKNTHDINILYFGSGTHYFDLNESGFTGAIDRIFSEYPNVTITTIGAFLEKMRARWGHRYQEANGRRDIYEWINEGFPERMTNADIVVAPLTDDIYNRSKSGIKYLEYSSAGKPGVYSNMRQYQKYVVDGENGYLAGKESEWYRALKELIDSPEKRKEIGEAAFKRVEQETIQEHVKQYADLFKKLLNDKSS